jgi:hypothetical protein
MGAAVADRLEGDIAKTVGATQSGLSDATARVISQAAAGTPQYVAPTSQAEADAGAFGARYTGPWGLSNEDVAAAEAGITKAGEQGKYGATDAGIATLLQQQYGQGYTGVGGRSLDAALVRRGAGERLEKAGSAGVDKLKEYLGTAARETAAAAEQGSVKAGTVRQQYGQWAPPQTDDVRRNPIQTPGTMPARGNTTIYGLPLGGVTARGVARWGGNRLINRYLGGKGP